jgi:hypothetical protein
VCHRGRVWRTQPAPPHAARERTRARDASPPRAAAAAKRPRLEPPGALGEDSGAPRARAQEGEEEEGVVRARLPGLARASWRRVCAAARGGWPDLTQPRVFVASPSCTPLSRVGAAAQGRLCCARTQRMTRAAQPGAVTWLHGSSCVRVWGVVPRGGPR